MRYTKLVLYLVLLTGISACQDQTLPPFSNETEVNRWIYDRMKLWYYWEDKLPSKPDFNQRPDDFFEGILYHFDPNLRPDGDRFSWIQDNADELTSSLSGSTVSYGMEFRIAQVTSLNKTFGTILYVFPDSPAFQAGLRRGDHFTEINGQEITFANSRNLLSGNSPKQFTIADYDPEDRTFTPRTTVTLSPSRYQEDPVHEAMIFTRGEKRIGYLVYHQFFPSTNGTNDMKFDRKLETVFDTFRNQQINELIVDLRYNSGGYVSSATLLGSLIAPGVTAKDPFAVKEYNTRITEMLRETYGKNVFYDFFMAKPQNVGSLLNRVYFLTSSRTASASELLINGLKPYIEVKIAGDTTVGKNVGSITLSDAEMRTRWGLQPIVSKSFNSLLQSDYTSGFAPDFRATEGIVIYPYGDDRDPLLKAALADITGSSGSNARMADSFYQLAELREIASSLDHKPGAMFEILPELVPYSTSVVK